MIETVSYVERHPGSYSALGEGSKTVPEPTGWKWRCDPPMYGARAFPSTVGDAFEVWLRGGFYENDRAVGIYTLPIPYPSLEAAERAQALLTEAFALADEDVSTDA